MHVPGQALGPDRNFHNYIDVSRSELSPSLVEVALKRIATGATTGCTENYHGTSGKKSQFPQTSTLKKERQKSGRGDNITVCSNWVTLHQ